MDHQEVVLSALVLVLHALRMKFAQVVFLDSLKLAIIVALKAVLHAAKQLAQDVILVIHLSEIHAPSALIIAHHALLPQYALCVMMGILTVTVYVLRVTLSAKLVQH